jgi:hypothetical protein
MPRNKSWVDGDAPIRSKNSFGWRRSFNEMSQIVTMDKRQKLGFPDKVVGAV